MGIILSEEEIAKIEKKKLEKHLCFNADCKHCYKSEPKCKLSIEKMKECKIRKSAVHPSCGYPGSHSRDAYSEFSAQREREREDRKEARDKKALQEYRKLKRAKLIK